MTPRCVDLSVVGQDPWFRGGSRAQAEAFWRAAVQLGREPHLVFLARERTTSLLRRSLALDTLAAADPPFAGSALPSFLPELDSLNQLAGGFRMSRRLRASRSVWVVATMAQYGYGAARSGRPYGCWIGTGSAEEWASRRAGLPTSRRLALGLNAPVLRRLEREVLRRARVLCATSAASRRSVAAAAGLPLEGVRVLPIPVDLDRLAPEPDGVWIGRLERPAIVFIGRGNDPRKNLGLLLRAFPAIHARAPGARLQLVGTPPDPAVAASLPAGVEILGELDDVARPLREASLFVLPSLQEGFGIVVAEALASGVPSVVTPSGGPEELVRESGGGLVLDGFDPDELGSRLSELLEDAERLLAMRRSGRDYVSRVHAPARFRALLGQAFAELDGPPA